MPKHLLKYIFLPICVILFFFTFGLPNETKADESEKLILRSSTEKINLYPSLYMLQDNKRTLTIDDVASADYADDFILSEHVIQKGGFFEIATWLRVDIQNQSDEEKGLLEFAFPLIYYINIYSETETGIVELEETGANFPFHQRKIDHRNFIFNLDIEPNTTKTLYILVHGGGDLHPPINIWEADTFIEKTQAEFTLLGLFYGMILVMILYNLFLYFSLRIKSYLYYVLAITCTIMGQLSINGLAFQYLWPDYPSWNLISAPFWVSTACIFILIFTRNFLDADQYIPKFKFLSYLLIALNAIVILTLFISHYAALSLMALSAISTFTTVVTVGFICLKRVAWQARFFIVGWLIFLVGVTTTILERAVLLPFSTLTEYAGQASLTIEVVVLSFALADKINIMRTEKEQAEQAAKKSQALAIESLKKTDELKDEFLAITSHEIRTPLYGMIGIAESLRDGVTGELPAEMNNQLSVIISSGNRLTHLVNDILDFSKLKHDSVNIHLKPIHLSGIVDVIFMICQPFVKDKSIRLINKIDDSLPVVFADPDRLQQILYNLIGNAIKYTDEGEIIISAKKKHEFFKINVSDTGKGISKEQLKSIFDPFKQGDISLSRDAGGIGIGLSITKQLVELHDGILKVDSKVGVGSVFSFTLPLKDYDEYVDEAASTIELPLKEEPVLSTLHMQPKQKTTATILVADDEPVNLQVLTNQLTLEGYRVITASTGEEVLSIIDEKSIELLILDIMMPKMSGYEVCQRLRKEYSLTELPILMLTAKNQVRDKITSFEVGANDYLAKPCDKQELLSRVKTLVRLRSLNQELITMNLQLEEKVHERTEELEVANDDLIKVNDDLITLATSRRQLLANIAHELGTPVMLIHSYVQALQAGLVDAEDPYYGNLVYDKINVLNRLINDLSDLANLERGQISLNFKMIQVDTWIEKIYHKLKFDLTRYERLFESTDDLDRLKGFSCSIDIERMDQVFSNLISNAVKNTSETDGKISIKTGLDENNKHLIIEVKDNGKGISQENLPLIFERFFKGAINEEKSGIGLGLAIVNDIIQAHQASIHVESKLGEGSTFYITLPVRKTDELER